MHFPQIHGALSVTPQAGQRESYPACQWLPLWGSWRAQARLRGQGRFQTALTPRSYRSDKEPAHRCAAALSCRACPLRHCFAMPPLPKGEALAGRFTSYWTPEVRQGAKGRALLTGTAASGQRSLSSCRWPRQRSTATSETSCFARPDESWPTCQGLPLWGNGDDRRQWRKQGGAVGAAASRMRATAKQTLGAATRPWRAQARLRGLGR